MKESHSEGVETRTGPESCGAVFEGSVEALTGIRAGRVLSRETNSLRGADAVEEGGRRLAKGNPRQQNALRTPSRQGAPSALERVRQAAKRNRKLQFTALLHHIYDVDRLRAAYGEIERNAAAGVDGETWRHYGERLE